MIYNEKLLNQTISGPGNASQNQRLCFK